MEPNEDLARLEALCGLVAARLADYYADPSPRNWRALLRLHSLLTLASTGPARGLRDEEHGE